MENNPSNIVDFRLPGCIGLLRSDLGANDGVAKSDGGDVGGTWLQLMCCTLPKHLSLICLGGLEQKMLEVVGVGSEVLY